MTRRSFLGRLAGGLVTTCLATGVPLSALPAPVRHRAADDAFRKFVAAYKRELNHMTVQAIQHTPPRHRGRYPTPERIPLLAHVSPGFCDDLIQCPSDTLRSWSFKGIPLPAVTYREYRNVIILVNPALAWGEIRFQRV